MPVFITSFTMQSVDEFFHILSRLCGTQTLCLIADNTFLINNFTMTPKEQQIIDTLMTAIKGDNLIEFKYSGEYRIVEPYLIGELYSIHQNHLEEGIYALRAWFVKGYTSHPTDRKVGDRWRKYELKKIMELNILTATNNKVRPLYNPNDKDFKRILFRVEIKK
ncbi:MAG: hypothetical protein K1X81_11220 [Bacteroidia bacterium]|nr:hypothetical protein [Bacteroidia bacterium]